MEPESPSPYPQVPSTCLYPEPTPSSPPTPSNFLKIVTLTLELVVVIQKGKHEGGGELRIKEIASESEHEFAIKIDAMY
jgi:hypothetical protein